MKFFVQILALYLLALSCLPCNDGEHQHGQIAGSIPTQHSLTTDEHGCPGHDHCADFCSPLCSCQCCSTNLALQQPMAFTVAQKTPFSETYLSLKARRPLKDMAFAIDHPPQLG